MTMNINYKIIYAKRKTVSIRVADDGAILVRAPYGVKSSEIERIVAKNQKWLEEHIKANAEKQKLYNNTDEKELEAKAREKLLPLVEYYSNKMGKKPVRVSFTGAKKRFGSCSSKGVICFSRYLMLYPYEAYEYVVVHELAHLFEMNHSARFYAIVEQYLPDYRERKSLLTLENL